jgi:hypothetical protein
LNIQDFAFSLCASSTINALKVFFSVFINCPDPVNRFDISVFLSVQVSLLLYTSRGAEFFVTYCASISSSLVTPTRRLTATTDLPVPGPHSTINIFLFALVDCFIREIAFS